MQSDHRLTIYAFNVVFHNEVGLPEDGTDVEEKISVWTW